MAPCAVGPRAGARLCGGLGAPATPQYLRVCLCVSGLSPPRFSLTCARVSLCTCSISVLLRLSGPRKCESVNLCLISLHLCVCVCDSEDATVCVFCGFVDVVLYMAPCLSLEMCMNLCLALKPLYCVWDRVCVSLCHLSVSVCISKFLNNSVCSGVSEFCGIWVCVCACVLCLAFRLRVFLGDFVCLYPGHLMSGCGVSLTCPWSPALANPRPPAPEAGPGPPSPGVWGGGATAAERSRAGKERARRARREAGGPTGQILPSAGSAASLHLLVGDSL